MACRRLKAAIAHLGVILAVPIEIPNTMEAEMSLNIESGFLRAEALNHPNDLYIYFEGGFFVYSIRKDNPPCGIWFNGDMFLLAEWKFKNGAAEAAVILNEWAQQMLAA